MARDFIPSEVKEKTRPFKGLYMIAWKYGTWYIKFEGPQKGGAWKNVRYYIFHGTLDDKNKTLSRLKVMNLKEGRGLVWVKEVRDLDQE
jgi:hypothetical protein